MLKSHLSGAGLKRRTNIIQEALTFVMYLKRGVVIVLISLCFGCPGYAAGRELTLQWDSAIDDPYLQSYRIYYYTTPGDIKSLNTTDYALSYKLAGGSPIALNPLTDPKPITINKSNSQITLHFSDASKIYYFAVAAVDTRGVESIPASLDAPRQGGVGHGKTDDQTNKAHGGAAANPLKKAPAEQESKDVPKAPGGAAIQDDQYIIGPEDVLSIYVWREESLTKMLPVRIDGKISLPLLDDIQAAGLTPLQLKNVLIEKLKNFIDNPTITVTVMEANSFKVYVTGEVKQPGVHRIRSEITLVRLIIMVGGFTEWADQKRILIITKEKGVEKRISANYKKIIEGEEPDILIKRDDTIIVR